MKSMTDLKATDLNTILESDATFLDAGFTTDILKYDQIQNMLCSVNPKMCSIHNCIT